MYVMRLPKALTKIYFCKNLYSQIERVFMYVGNLVTPKTQASLCIHEQSVLSVCENCGENVFMRCIVFLASLSFYEIVILSEETLEKDNINFVESTIFE